MTEPRRDDHHTDADASETTTGPGGESPDPEFGEDATIPDQET